VDGSDKLDVKGKKKGMKRLILILLLTCLVINAFSQTAFTLSGKITGADGARVVLTYADVKGVAITDSSRVNNESFAFKGDVNGGFLATIAIYKTVAEKNANEVKFFLEPGNITVSGDYSKLNELKFSGSNAQQEYQAFQQQIDDFNKSYQSFSDEFNKVNSAYERAKKDNATDKKLDSIYKILKPLQQQREVYAAKYEDITRNFIATHPNSYVSAFEMGVYTSLWPVDSVKMQFNNLSPAVQYSYYGTQIQKAIAAIDSKSANTIAPNFTAADLNGKKLTLANFKGRFVLLDFWASWCLPCRESNPHLIELYKRYHKAGFDVIAIAEDDDAVTSWKKAIQKDGTALWHNVLSGRKGNKSSPNSITYKFSIGALPTKILIDKNGTIIGRYTEADEKAMDEKLAAIFGK